MSTFAYLPIVADRAGPCIRTISFVGIDLTDVTLAMEIRLYPDQPGAAKLSLAQVSDNSEGVRLMGVSTVGGVSTSEVRIRINETTMEDNSKIPYSGEIGAASEHAYGLIGTFGGDKRTLTTGPFVALATVYGADGAPTDRAYSGTSGARWSTWSNAAVTFSDDRVTVSIDGLDLVAPYADRAEQAADRAEQALADWGALVETDTGRNLINPNTATAGQRLYANGVILADASYTTSDSIPVVGGEIYSSNGLYALAEYDASDVYITGGDSTPLPNEIGYRRLNASTAFVRVSWLTANAAEARLTAGTTAALFDAPMEAKKSLADLRLSAGQVIDALTDQYGRMDPAFVIQEPNAAFIERQASTGELFDPATMAIGYDIDISNGNIGNTPTLVLTDFIAVTPGVTYQFGPAGSYYVFYNADRNYLSGGGSANSATAPVGAAWMRLNFALGGEATYTVYAGSAPAADTYRPRPGFHLYALAPNVLPRTPPLAGAIWNAMGDSITAGGGGIDPYHEHLAPLLGVSLVRNYGIGGTLISDAGPNPAQAMVNRVAAMDANAQLVTIMGGTNDFANLIPLGTPADTTSATFHGALYETFLAMVTRYPTAKLAAFTMTPREDQFTPRAGGSLFDYADAILEMAGRFSIPALDVLRNSRLRPYDATNEALYYGGDGLHMNTTGHQTMTPLIRDFLEKL